MVGDALIWGAGRYSSGRDFFQSFEVYGPRNSPENKPAAYFRFVR